MKKYNVGIIGCGARTRCIAQLLLAANKQIRVTAVSDPSGESVEQARRVLGRDLSAYPDYRELLKHPGLSWVMIGSWNCYHREHAVAAFEAGKHVFCEKPLATTLEDCRAIRDAWRKTDRLFSIGFSLRYSPHYRNIKRLLAGGAVGKIISLEFNETLAFNHGGLIMSDWRRFKKNAGPHLLEKCCHDVDLVNWFVESCAHRVASFGGLNFFTPENAEQVRRLGKDAAGRKAYSAYDGGQKVSGLNPFTCDKDIVDNQVAIIEYANGVRATFHTNMNSGIPERRMYICGTEGTIRADSTAGRIEVRRIGFNEKSRDVSVRAKGSHAGGDIVLARELAALIVRGEPVKTGMDDALKSAVTCFGIDQAMTTGQVVAMTPLWKRAGVNTRTGTLGGG